MCALSLPDVLYRECVCSCLQPEDRQKATQAWAKIQHSLTQLGVTAGELRAIVHVLAAIYHLGVAGAETGATSKAQFSRPAAAQRASTLLGMTQEELTRVIFSSANQQAPPVKPTFRLVDGCRMACCSMHGRRGAGVDDCSRACCSCLLPTCVSMTY